MPIIVIPMMIRARITSADPPSDANMRRPQRSTAERTLNPARMRKPRNQSLTSAIRELFRGQTRPIGLIVNELVTNAVKYAFPGEANGTVMVTLKRAPGGLRLTVADDGQWLDPRRGDSGLGGRLVDGFAQQLGGQVERKSDSQGTTVHLTLPSREGS